MVRRQNGFRHKALPSFSEQDFREMRPHFEPTVCIWRLEAYTSKPPLPAKIRQQLLEGLRTWVGGVEGISPKFGVVLVAVAVAVALLWAKEQSKGNTRNHGLMDLYVYVFFGPRFRTVAAVAAAVCGCGCGRGCCCCCCC